MLKRNGRSRQDLAVIRAAGTLRGARTASRFPGLDSEAHVVDWRRPIAAKDDLVATLRQKKYIDLSPEYPAIAYLEGAAPLLNRGERRTKCGLAYPEPKEFPNAVSEPVPA